MLEMLGIGVSTVLHFIMDNIVIIKEKKVLESKTYSSAIKAGKSIKTM